MRAQAAVDYVLKCLNGSKSDLKGAAKQLVEHAVHRLNSNDNVTVGTRASFVFFSCFRMVYNDTLSPHPLSVHTHVRIYELD